MKKLNNQSNEYYLYSALLNDDLSSYYLTNKDMMFEIHKSKISFCEYHEARHTDYDIILDDKTQILLPETKSQAKINRAARISERRYKKAIKDGVEPKPKQSQFKISPDIIKDSDLVYRVMTYEHIPLAPGRKKTVKTESDKRAKVNFPPFKHYIVEDGEVVEVLKSHSKNGEFDCKYGAITDKLAKMFLLMVYKYSQRSNWRGYTYLDEMMGQALLQLSFMGLQFNEAKSNNPFSYYTASMANSFTRVLNIEKKNQDIRDDLLIQSGQNPSMTRQVDNELEVQNSKHNK